MSFDPPLSVRAREARDAALGIVREPVDEEPRPDLTLAYCSFCGEEVDRESSRTYRRVIGWEHPRSEGGTNALALREPLDEWACFLCIDKLRRQIAPGQGSFF